MIDYVNQISVADYNALRQSVGWNIVEDTQAKIGIGNSFFLVSALADGQTVGMTRVISDGGYYMLVADVIVHPDFQGQGIGRAMMTQAMARIYAHLGPGQKVIVNLLAAKNKEPFYEHFGFIKRPNDQYGAGMVQYLTPEKQK